MVSTELPARRRSGSTLIAHGVNNHGGKRANEMGRKNHRLRLQSVALGRSRYCLLISVVQLQANRQAYVLVDTLHCKTEQRRASIDIVKVISLIHRSICQSRLRSQPVRLANCFANKATILANNAHTVMIQQKRRYQNVKIALFGNRK